MAYVSSNRNHTISLTARLGEVLGNFRDAWRAYGVYRQTFNELSALSDRELADLGVARSELARVAYEAAYGAEALR